MRQLLASESIAVAVAIAAFVVSLFALLLAGCRSITRAEGTNAEIVPSIAELTRTQIAEEVAKLERVDARMRELAAAVEASATAPDGVHRVHTSQARLVAALSATQFPLRHCDAYAATTNAQVLPMAAAELEETIADAQRGISPRAALDMEEFRKAALGIFDEWRRRGRGLAHRPAPVHSSEFILDVVRLVDHATLRG